VETSDEWRSQELVLGLALLSIFLSYMDSGIVCILSKFAHKTKLCGAVNTPEGSKAIQRDLDRLERWTCLNLLRLNKAKCKVPHMGQSKPPVSTQPVG